MAGALRLRPPHPDEYPALTELCLRSKAHWGYDQAFMEACRTELTLTARNSEPELIRVAEAASGVVGLVEVSVEGEHAELEKLIVEPAVIGSGIGRVLFGWAVETVRAMGARRLTIDSDPDAASIYRRLGAVDDGTAPSGSITGRMLPRLAVEIGASDDR